MGKLGSSKYRLHSSSAVQTESIGKAIAESLQGGEIIELSSDLGGGKTTLTRGIARGLGVLENITSPTFVVSKVYKGDSLELHHYDFYRLNEIGIMSEEIKEVLENTKNITVIEWAGDLHESLPQERIIGIELLPLQNESTRELIIKGPDYILAKLESFGAKKC
jgi:tRNA threonylcarbamoyladenosine biosynthesis protein TsaE